jgi:hypothetical protein
VASTANSEYLIEGLISQPSLTLVVGDSGIGKSPLLYQAMLCVAANVPFLGRNVRQGRALVMDCENGVEQVVDIVSQLSKHLNLERVPDDLRLWNLNDCAENWGENGHDLRELLQAVKPDVVVADPLNAIFQGIESDNTKAGAALGEIRALMRDFNCSFIGLHHPRKFDSKHISVDDSLEFGNLLRWFDSTRGPRVLINGTDFRLGIEPVATCSSQLILRGFRRVLGEVPMLRVGRVLDDDGDPVGYNCVSGADLLNPEQAGAFKRLPMEFEFKEAMAIYGRQNQATTDFLKKCIGAGLVRKVAKGRYRKTATANETGPLVEVPRAA